MSADVTLPAGRPLRANRSWRNEIMSASLATQVLLILAAIVTVIPVIWTVLSSLKSNDTIFAIPMRWLPDALHWSNYSEAFEVAPFGR
jgi:multiple sugar transport system permease protein